MNLRFLPAAREELDAAAAYLDDRVLGLGKEFVDDVERTGSLVCQFAQMGRPLDSIHRAIPLQRFSFNVVYRIEGDEIIVIALAHKRRRPGYWR
jgi:plasmid stabilization system protein ParE